MDEDKNPQQEQANKYKESQEEIETYISLSKRNIDNYMRKREYRKAFGILIMFLERLDDIEIRQVVDYYSKNMQDLGVFTDSFPSR
jgi:intergrase/recombinase